MVCEVSLWGFHSEQCSTVDDMRLIPIKSKHSQRLTNVIRRGIQFGYVHPFDAWLPHRSNEKEENNYY